MLFLVISTPRPEQPSKMAAARKQYWTWIQKLRDSGVAKVVYPRTGRGVVVIFDVESHDMLHRLIGEWSEMVPAHFDFYPLLEPDEAIRALGGAAQ